MSLLARMSFASLVVAGVLACMLGAAPPTGAPASGPAAATTDRLLDVSAFAHAEDALGDIKPVTRMASRLPARITGATLDLGKPSGEFAQRTVRSAIELTSTDARGAVAVLGSFGWSGSTLQWSWNRVSLRQHGKAVEALSSALALCSLDVQLEGGAHVRVQAPPQELRAAVRLGVAKRFKVVVPAGEAVAIEVAADGTWAAPDDAPPPGTVVRRADCGDMRISWEPATSECVVTWLLPGAAEIDALKAQIAERRREAARRSPDEQRIIEGEIAGLERKIVEYAASLPKSGSAFAPFPATVLKGPDGRVYAKIDIIAPTKASK